MLEVVITGTGFPRPDPNRAGPGVLVRDASAKVQIDAGRATVMRLAAEGVRSADLDVLLLTHHHSDHVMGVVDIAMSRWMESGQRVMDSLPVAYPDGPLRTFLDRAFVPWQDDIEVRVGHSGTDAVPAFEQLPFTASHEPGAVGSWGDLHVSSILVRHEPVLPAVAYRVENDHGAVVVSGDTVVCDEVCTLAQDAQVLVHSGLSHQAVAGLPYEWVKDYHADSVGIGAMAKRAGIKVLLLTHLIPPPNDPGLRQQFIDDVRGGGFEGEIVVCDDLDRVEIIDGAPRIVLHSGQTTEGGDRA